MPEAVTALLEKQDLELTQSVLSNILRAKTLDFSKHTEYKDIVKTGKVLSSDQFTSLDQQAQNYANQSLTQTKNDLEVEHVKAQIGEAKAAIAAHQATTRGNR